MNHGAARCFGLLLVGVVARGGDVSAGPSASALEKVHPLVLSTAAASGASECLVVLEAQADLSDVSALPTKNERGQRVYERLSEIASRTQQPLLDFLVERGVPHQAFWIVNMIWVRADLAAIEEIAVREDVRRIDANPVVHLEEPGRPAGGGEAAVPTSIEWGIAKTAADQVWALGYDGSGIVVAGQDTGYDWTHPALKAHYRGWNGAQASHDYNWHDAIHSGGGGICGVNSSVPCDDFGHGTHTMGTMVGDDGGSNQIGMAPGARWIGCRNMNQGNGTPATYSECFQFLVAPTTVSGSAPDPSKAPHVINDSWGCPPSEGCSPETLEAVVENTRAAGIVVVASAGNSGSACETVQDPPAIYDASFTVGATDSSDVIAGFSSRGPVTIDGSNRLKPDVSAPGVSVRSCVPGGGYEFLSGTSMAGPHVAGLVALLLDARPDLLGQVETVEEIIRHSAVPLTSTKTCGGIPGSDIPNPIYGWGRVDALQAIAGDTDGDGHGNLSDCAPTDGLVWEPPGPARELTLAQNSLVMGLFWKPPLGMPAGGVHYDVLRSIEPGDFSSCMCVASSTVNTTAFDIEIPSTIFYYLVRSRNECGTNLGTASDGTPRVGGPCPGQP